MQFTAAFPGLLILLAFGAPEASAEPCFIGADADGVGVGVGDDFGVSGWPQFWCEKRYADCGGLYLDIYRDGIDSFTCQPVAW